MKIVFFCIILLSAFNAETQSLKNWEKINLPVIPYEPRCMYNDTVANILYVGGHIFPDTIGGQPWGQERIICKYNGSVWDTLGRFNGAVLSMVVFNGELYAGGFFTEVNGQQMTIAKYDGVNWISVGICDYNIWSLRVLEGNLYATGSFSVIDGDSINNIARLNGNDWESVEFPYIPGGGYINDVIIYQGDLYVGGNFDFLFPSDSLEDLLVYKNNSWQQVGQGLSGSWTAITKMLEYNNELVIAGAILKSEGNVGNGVQKWNGSSWSELGTGIQDDSNSYNDIVQVFEMKTHNNNLYVHSRYYAGNIPTYGIALWDGNYWCGLGQGINETEPYWPFDFYNDTLFAQCVYFDSLNMSLSIGLFKLGDFSVDTCSVPMNVNESENEDLLIDIYPNPNNGDFNLTFNTSFSFVNIKIYDGLGRMVYSENKNNIIAGNIFLLKIPDPVSGLYFLSVESENGIFTSKILVN